MITRRRREFVVRFPQFSGFCAFYQFLMVITAQAGMHTVPGGVVVASIGCLKN